MADQRIATTASEELMAMLADICQKYGMTLAAAMRLLMVEGYESMKEQGRI